MKLKTVFEMVSEIFGSLSPFRRPPKRIGHEPTPQKRSNSIKSTHNHGKGESKVRRKMAAKSRRINRGK